MSVERDRGGRVTAATGRVTAATGRVTHLYLRG